MDNLQPFKTWIQEEDLGPAVALLHELCSVTLEKERSFAPERKEEPMPWLRKKSTGERGNLLIDARFVGETKAWLA